jgi:hypothetical protein
VDEEGVKETAKFFNVDPVFLEGMYHDVMLGPRWTQAAGTISDWLDSIYGPSPLSLSAAKPTTADVAAVAAATTSTASASVKSASAEIAASSDKDKTATKPKTPSQIKAQAQDVAENSIDGNKASAGNAAGKPAEKK